MSSDSLQMTTLWLLREGAVATRDAPPLYVDMAYDRMIGNSAGVQVVIRVWPQGACRAKPTLLDSSALFGSANVFQSLTTNNTRMAGKLLSDDMISS